MKLHLPGRRGWILALFFGAGALCLPLVFDVEEHEGVWQIVPGFWAWYGAIGCAAIVIASKLLGKTILQRPEGWYERRERK